MRIRKAIRFLFGIRHQGKGKNKVVDQSHIEQGSTSYQSNQSISLSRAPPELVHWISNLPEPSQHNKPEAISPVYLTPSIYPPPDYPNLLPNAHSLQGPRKDSPITSHNKSSGGSPPQRVPELQHLDSATPLLQNQRSYDWNKPLRGIAGSGVKLSRTPGGVHVHLVSTETGEAIPPIPPLPKVEEPVSRESETESADCQSMERNCCRQRTGSGIPP